MPQSTYPILELIAQNIEDELRKISLTNGYQNDVKVERRKVRGNPLTDNLLVIHQDDTPKLDETPQDATTWRQPFLIACFAVESDSSTTAIDTRLNSLAADVEKCLMIDFRRGGHAIDTIPRQKQYNEDTDAGAAWVVLWFDVEFRHERADPYTGR